MKFFSMWSTALANTCGRSIERNFDHEIMKFLHFQFEIVRKLRHCSQNLDSLMIIFNMYLLFGKRSIIKT